jgi:CubicO group peptidase (beta-lactamase class C family)
VATERMTVRDVVSHRLGLGRHDAIWYGSPFTRDELFARLQYLDFGLDFRDRFQYNNLGFLTAGQVVEAASGLSWEDFTRQRIFEPLGMDDSNFSVDDSKKASNHAVPHMLVDGEVRAIAFRNIDNAGPAGSINSSVNDILKWVQLHLSKGTFGNTTIISEDGQKEMYTPVTALREPMLPVQPDGQSVMVYGMGWFIETYRGHMIVHHGGSIDGFYALILYMPNDDIGAVVLTNLGTTPLLQIAMGHLLDTVLDLDPVWPELTIERWEKAKEDEEKAKQAELEEEKKWVMGTRPSHPLADYAGVYEHPAYGVMTVDLEGGALTLSRNSSMRRLEHWHYDQFRGEVGGVYSDLGGLMVTFHTNHEGDADRLSAPFDPTLPVIEFTRKPPQE